jgi:uncharacterized protein YjbI with pentapeptide repeats
MANPEHEAILRQGVEIWNKWRVNNHSIRPDLIGTALGGTNLFGANLRGVDLRGADLRGADLRAYLSGADLRGADLTKAGLRGADLRAANLSNANLTDAVLGQAVLIGLPLYRAILSNTDLMGANLTGAGLDSANLTGAILIDANLSNANLDDANLEKAMCGGTIFAKIDLSTAKGLDTIDHRSPSELGVETIFQSKGKIPEIFLRGCGVPETLITFLPSMYEEAIMFYSCFISYSHDDKEFAKRLHDRLQGVGIRCWLDEHQLKPGDELHKTIYEGIRVYDKVILCCSETALKSWWVEKEFKNAITKEEDYTETVLIPITLDDYLFKQSKDNWTIGEINRRFVQDFSGWKDHDAFEATFKKVVDALRTDGGKPPPPTPKLTPRK